MITDAETAQLTAWSRRPTTVRAIAERAPIILASATGAPSLAVGEPVVVTRRRLANDGRRLLADRVEGLLDEPRPLLSATISDGDETIAVDIGTAIC